MINLRIHLNFLEKQEQIKLKISTQAEINKIKAEFSETMLSAKIYRTNENKELVL